ncbi:MAG: NifU family protein [Flavobacteriales bacterium]|jgi:Fe-S cluster biogenesis protein NfuA
MSYNEVLQKVEDSLTKIRPFLHADGGDVKVVEFTSDYNLKLEFIGACKDCSMNRMTFKAGIEENIRRDVPEVISIEAIGV